MTTANQQRLINQVEGIAMQLEVPFEEWDPEIYEPEDEEYGYSAYDYAAYDYLEGVLDIVNISRPGQYLGAELCVAFGGPNIYINTREKSVEGFWWGDHHKVWLKSAADENIADLNEYLEDIFHCV